MSNPDSVTSWRLVRHVPEGNKWHPATDQLKGTDVYGDKNDKSQPFSVKWDTEEYDQVFDRFVLHIHFPSFLVPPRI